MLNRCCVGIIGAGRVGGSFAIALKKKLKSIKVTLCKTTKISLKPKSERDYLESHSEIINSIEKLVTTSDIIFIAVKDDKIADIVDKIARLKVNIDNKYFFHFSGSLTSDIFIPLKKKARVFVASLHPVQSFPNIKEGVKKILNIYWILEGDRKAWKAILPVIKSLNGKIVFIDKELKVLHHIVCVYCGNFITGLLHIAEELALEGKLNRQIYFPLLESVIDNIKNARNASEVLTGPLIRGDINTIKTHLKYLESYPEFLQSYKYFSRILLEMVKNKLEEKTYNKLSGLLVEN